MAYKRKQPMSIIKDLEEERGFKIALDKQNCVCFADLTSNFWVSLNKEETLLLIEELKVLVEKLK